jgi:4-hydroxybenzoate polyprenyltransferase
MTAAHAWRRTWQTAGTLATDIKLAHSVFALPFALLAACMAAMQPEAPLAAGRFAAQIGLVILAMVTARTAAMLANRYLDRHVDAANPRTVGRALPSGRVSAAQMLGGIVVAVLLFECVCLGFLLAFDNPWPLMLSLPVLAWIMAYPLTKRFTALCHVYLGSSLATSPLAAAIAIEPSTLGSQPGLWLLAGTVLLWVAGFDIIYALQDIDIDQRDGLYSLPGRLGPARALLLSRAMHAAAAICLTTLTLADPRLGVVFGTAVALTIALLIYEHATVARWGTTKIALAFFTLNGIISCLLGGAGIVDLVRSALN